VLLNIFFLKVPERKPFMMCASVKPVASGCAVSASLLKLYPEEELLDSNVVMRLPEQTVEQMS